MSAQASPARLRHAASGTGRHRVDPILSRSLAFLVAAVVLRVAARLLDPEGHGPPASCQLAGDLHSGQSDTRCGQPDIAQVFPDQLTTLRQTDNA